MTSIYLAAAWDRAAQMRQVREILRDLGFEVTSRWLNGDEKIVDTEFDAGEAVVAAQQDVADIMVADIVIVYTRSPSTTGGRHVEFGIALATGKQIVIIGPRENIFQAWPDIEQFPSFSRYVEHLRSSNAATRSTQVNSDKGSKGGAN